MFLLNEKKDNHKYFLQRELKFSVYLQFKLNSMALFFVTILQDPYQPNDNMQSTYEKKSLMKPLSLIPNDKLGVYQEGCFDTLFGEILWNAQKI